jgi:hypothetical protein
MGAEPAGQWTLTITCPRPKNRAVDDFHVRPDKVTRVGVEWFGEGAELTLTARTVRLTQTTDAPVRDLTMWQQKLATVLYCLMLDTHTNGGAYRLPRPVRTEVHEKERVA